ncbi:MAG: right-handed parallel beta-helix repeat-containing protein [Proteobacteria bacterium]|nr:right-handed parallel beta-helix repeat-containing protein [Pseudomonadota bacterium]
MERSRSGPGQLVIRTVVVMFAIVSASPAWARDVVVTNTTELVAAITAAQPGDTISLEDGTYASTGASCSAVGTAAAPIVVRARHPLGAKIEFDAVEGFKVSGAYWTFEGLDIRGVCPIDDACEHAFHVFGAADHFTLTSSRVRDFNAQLKVNIGTVNGAIVAPNAGLVAFNELSDTRPRNTANPVTKLNIDGGDDWIVRGNYVHDGTKAGGDQTSYAVFMKSGGKRGVMERNLVICARDDQTAATRIGLSLGGGGTAPQFCAPAYDASVPCAVEHEGGTLRNNIIVNCSDVGIYLNRARDSKVLFNTLIATAGIDFRFDTTSGEAHGNLLTGVVRTRDGATMTATSNREAVALSTFQTWYVAPLVGDLTAIGDLVTPIGTVPTRTEVPDDYCAKPRSSGMTVGGAIDHLQGGCVTTVPPVGPDGGPSDHTPVNGDAGMDGASAGGCCSTQTRDGSRGGTICLAIGVLLGIGRKRTWPDARPFALTSSRGRRTSNRSRTPRRFARRRHPVRRGASRRHTGGRHGHRPCRCRDERRR